MQDLDKPQDLHTALAEIAEIRHHIARGAEFRGYGPATLAATGVLAILAAVAQALWIGNPAGEVTAYLWLWTATAAAAAIMIGAEAVTRSRRLHVGLAPEMLAAAGEQFLPAAASGVLLTAVLVRFVPDSQWMIPGLWQIVFSLGVFASCRFLPRRIFLAGIWYLLCGLGCLIFARDTDAFSPWAMGIPFGIGQLLIAVLLHSKAWDDKVGDADARV